MAKRKKIFRKEVEAERTHDELVEQDDINESRKELDHILADNDTVDDPPVENVVEDKPQIKKQPQFSNPVEVWEKKVYWIKAKNRADVDAALKLHMSSQDELVSVKPLKGITYEAEVLVFRLRDGFA